MRRTAVLFAIALVFGITGCQQDDPPPEPEPTETIAAIEPVPAPDCYLTLGWDPWEPYHFMGPGGDVIGLDIDLVGAMAEHADCELSFRQDNWVNLLRMLQHGDLDLLLGATRTEEREAFAYFSAPYRTESFELYVRPDDIDLYQGKPLETLLDEGFRIGVTQGYIYSGNISHLQAEDRFADQFIDAPIGEISFTNLLDHHIDGFLEDPFVCAAIARRRGWQDQIEPLPLDLESGEVHIMFSRETVEESVVARFDEALDMLQTSGQYEAIRERYLN